MNPKAAQFMAASQDFLSHGHIRCTTIAKCTDAELIVGVTLHNQAHALADCLESVAEQRRVPLRYAILILDDDSRDDWHSGLAPFAELLPVAVVRSKCGSAARARNCLLDMVDSVCPSAKWVARLDADGHPPRKGRFAAKDLGLNPFPK